MEQKQQKEKDKKLLFSQYIEVQDILMNPLKPLVHIIGFQQTHLTIIQIISEAIQANPKNYKSFNIQSYEFYESSSPKKGLIYDNPFKTDKNKAQDLGYLKLSFFKALTIYKPAASILVFDWQNQENQGHDWKTYEAQVLAEVKQHQDKCPGARQSKIILLIFLPLNDQGSVDEKITSLKRAVAAQGGSENIKTFFLLTNGFDGLRNLSKKVAKNLSDLAHQYYREKKFAIKKKQKKLIKEQIENIRYSFKHGIFSSYTKQDYLKPIKYMKEAYSQLKQSLGTSSSRTTFDEKRENADLIMLKIQQMYISNDNPQGFLENYKQHFYSYSNRVTTLKREQKFEEMKWKANWFRIMAQFLETYNPKLKPEDDKQDFFIGYYQLNCMLQQIARKKEYFRLQRDKGSQLFDLDEMQGLTHRQPNMIGKDLIMQDIRDPLGGSNKTAAEFRILLEKFKLYQESKADIDSMILEYGHKAVESYKNKARSLKGNSSLMYRRMIHFISFHISEFILSESEGGQVKSQKYRGQIAKSLIQEGWTSEALRFVEKAKIQVSDTIEDFFQYEMEILNYTKDLSRQERHTRFLNLIDKITKQEAKEEQQSINLQGYLIGHQIIFARARFDHAKIQINNYNKLTVEIHSKIDQPIEISRIQIKLNELTLNQDLKENFTLVKGKPIIIEKELYLTNETALSREFILLNEIALTIGNEEQKQGILQLSLQPYLKPQEDLIDLNDQRKRPFKLREAIMFSIEPMPSKVNIRFSMDENQEQALLGDSYEVLVSLQPEDITLTNLNLQVENIDSEPLFIQEVQLPEQNINLTQSVDESIRTNATTVLSKQSSASQRIITVNRENPVFKSQTSNSLLSPTSTIPFNRAKSNLKDVEIFYTYDINSQDNIQELEINEGKVNIPTDCRQLKLIFKFYNESKNTVSLLFNYSFIQNSDTQKQELKQSQKKQFKVTSQSPFKVDWEIKTSDPYLQNLKLRNEALQLAPLLGPRNEECWIACNLISQSLSKSLLLNNAQLEIAEKTTIQKLSQLGFNDQYMDDNVRLEPGEAFSCLFQIQSTHDQISVSDIQSNTNRQNKPLDMEQFADLSFTWKSMPNQQDNAHLEQNQQLQKSNEFITCLAPSPSLTLIDIPIKVKELNENNLQLANLNNPISLSYQIENVSEIPIDCSVYIEETEAFFISGELKSQINLMPYQKYVLRYNLIPLQIGRLSLPKINLIDKEKNIPLIAGFTRKCLIVK